MLKYFPNGKAWLRALSGAIGWIVSIILSLLVLGLLSVLTFNIPVLSVAFNIIGIPLMLILLLFFLASFRQSTDIFKRKVKPVFIPSRNYWNEGLADFIFYVGGYCIIGFLFDPNFIIRDDEASPTTIQVRILLWIISVVVSAFFHQARHLEIQRRRRKRRRSSDSIDSELEKLRRGKEIK